MFFKQVFKKKRGGRLSIILIPLLLAYSVHAQDSESINEISDLGLPTLIGEITVFYSEGYDDRAAYLQEIVDVANHYFMQPNILDIELNLGLAVLDSADWALWTHMPYGMAHIQLGEEPVVIMPATKDNFLVNSLLAGKGRVSEETIQKLNELGFTFEEAALTYADLIAFHELGHIYSEAFDVWPTQKWLSEFTATYLAYSFMKNSRPKLAQLWIIFSISMIEVNDQGYTTLADFENLYTKVGGSNYGWYQAKFTQKVDEIYNKSGISFIYDLRESLAENPVAAEDDPFRLQELATFSDGFEGWAKGSDGNLE